MGLPRSQSIRSGDGTAALTDVSVASVARVDGPNSNSAAKSQRSGADGRAVMRLRGAVFCGIVYPLSGRLSPVRPAPGAARRLAEAALSNRNS